MTAEFLRSWVGSILDGPSWIVAIGGSLAAVGLAALIRATTSAVGATVRFRPFSPVWQAFARGDVRIFLSSRETGHSVKVSYSETEASDLIRKLLVYPFRRLKISVQPSHRAPMELGGGHIIAIGDEQYNEAARAILSHMRAQLTYGYTADNDLILNGKVFRSDYTNGMLVTDYALVCKTTNPFSLAHKAIVFAGNHGPGTLGAVIALTQESNARKIIARVGKEDFFVVVKIQFNERFANRPAHIEIADFGMLLESKMAHSENLDKARANTFEAFVGKLGAREAYLQHVRQVSSLALSVGRVLEVRGLDLDLEAVYFGAMLHDIGRTKRQDIQHGVEGGKILDDRREELMATFNLREKTFDKIREAVECHIVGGIPKSWIEESKLDLPMRDFIPQSTEAMIVGLADQLIHDWHSHDDVFREDPARAAEVFERLYYQCKDIMLRLFGANNHSISSPPSNIKDRLTDK